MRLTILGTQNDMRQSFCFIVNLTGLYYQSAKLLPSGNRTSQWKISHLWKFYDVLNIKTSMNRGFPIVMFHYRTIYKDDSAYSLKMGQLLPPQPNGQLWAISHFCLQPLPCLRGILHSQTLCWEEPFGKSPALRLWLAAACRVELPSATQKESCEHINCHVRRAWVVENDGIPVYPNLL